MTLNNYTEEETQALRNCVGDKIKYVTFIKETCDSGTPHLQIFAQGHTVLSVKQWHSLLGPRVSNIVQTKDIPKAIQYCQGYEWNNDTEQFQPKEGSLLDTMEEYGTPAGQGQGKRTDLETINEELKHKPLKHLWLENQYTQTLAAYHQHWKDKDQVYASDRMFKAAKAQHNEFMATRKKNDWEHLLDKIIDSHADPRVIHWFYDNVGDMGKTVNGKNLYFNHNTFYATGGKAADIYHAYQGEPIVILNLPASTDVAHSDYLYPILEGFKDGVVSSGKYNSQTKAFKIPHVIVFSNHAPDMTKVKANRIKAHNVHKITFEHGINPCTQLPDIICVEQDLMDFEPPTWV